MGLEPTTTSLATRYSTTELHPQFGPTHRTLSAPGQLFKGRICRVVSSGQRSVSRKPVGAVEPRPNGEREPSWSRRAPRWVAANQSLLHRVFGVGALVDELRPFAEVVVQL